MLFWVAILPIYIEITISLHKGLEHGYLIREKNCQLVQNSAVSLFSLVLCRKNGVWPRYKRLHETCVCVCVWRRYKRQFLNHFLIYYDHNYLIKNVAYHFLHVLEKRRNCIIVSVDVVTPPPVQCPDDLWPSVKGRIPLFPFVAKNRKAMSILEHVMVYLHVRIMLPASYTHHIF